MLSQNTTLPEKAQRILLKLYSENKEVVKTSLLKVVPNSYSLSNYLKLLEKEGDIKIREEKVIRKTYYISLTEKGVSVAEQIRRISDVGSKRGMELSDAFKLIIYLHNDGPKDVGILKKEFPGLFGFVEDMRSSGIITSKVDNSRYPPESLIELTEKGKEVAEKLKEIEEILRE